MRCARIAIARVDAFGQFLDGVMVMFTEPSAYLIRRSPVRR
jgi:hypothetical protein